VDLFVLEFVTIALRRSTLEW